MDPSEILKQFSFKEIFDNLVEYLSFYFKPRRYYDRFFSKNNESQFIQTFILIILFSFITFIFIDEISYRKQLAAIFIDVLATFIFCPIIYLSLFLTCKVQGVKFSKVFLFVLHSKFLIGPFYFISYLIFIKSELYEFYLLTNLVLVCQIYFSLFFFSYYHYSKLRRLILSLLINIVLINFLSFGIYKLSFDSRMDNIISKLYSDLIYDEYNELIEGKSFLYKYPTNKVHYLFNDGSTEDVLLLSSIGDSLTTGSIDSTQKYIANIKRFLSQVDSITPKLKYDRSKLGIALWENYLLEVSLNYLKTIEINAENLKAATRHVDENNNLLYYTFTSKDNDKIINLFLKTLDYQNEFIELSNKAEIVTILLLPTNILLYLTQNK